MSLEDAIKRAKWARTAPVVVHKYNDNMQIVKIRDEAQQAMKDRDTAIQARNDLLVEITSLKHQITGLRASNLLLQNRLKEAGEIISELNPRSRFNSRPKTPPIVKRTYPTMTAILNAVSDEFGTTPQELMSQRRNQPLSNYRHLAIMVTRLVTPLSYTLIGRAFNRDHTTAINAVNRAEELLVNDPALAERVETIRRTLMAPYANPDTADATEHEQSVSDAGTVPSPDAGIPPMADTCGLGTILAETAADGGEGGNHD